LRGAEALEALAGVVEKGLLLLYTGDRAMVLPHPLL